MTGQSEKRKNHQPFERGEIDKAGGKGNYLLTNDDNSGKAKVGKRIKRKIAALRASVETGNVGGKE